LGGNVRAFGERSNSGNFNFFSLSILAFLLASCASIAGCIGITSAPKTSTSTSPSQPAGHFVTLTWVPPSATDVAAYNVYRSKSAVGPFLRMATIVAAENEYVDNSVQAGETYYYVLTSVSLAGMESADSTQAIAPVP
jgi:hypothetical protein